MGCVCQKRQHHWYFRYVAPSTCSSRSLPEADHHRPAAMGGTYEFVKTASANLREKEDHWNVTLAGFFSGSILGLRGLSPSSVDMRDAILLTDTTVRTFPAVLGYGAALATTLGAFEYTGALWGYGKEKDEDKFERLEKLRKAYRTPAEETIAELGEGRGTSSHQTHTNRSTLTDRSGIYAPGYAERRRERIKQAYGIDVPVTQPSAS